MWKHINQRDLDSNFRKKKIRRKNKKKLTRCVRNTAYTNSYKYWQNDLKEKRNANDLYSKYTKYRLLHWNINDSSSNLNIYSSLFVSWRRKLQICLLDDNFLYLLLFKFPDSLCMALKLQWYLQGDLTHTHTHQHWMH